MTRKFIILLTALTTYLQVGQAQTLLKYGPELGLSISQFPIRETYSSQDGNKTLSWTRTPLFSPIVGLTTETTIRKHFQFTTGLLYQMTGQRFYEHRDGYDMLAGAKYTSDTWENQTFHKLCLPLSVGVTFKVWTLQPSIVIGDRPNLFLTGKYYSKFVFDHEINSEDITRENKFNPFDADKLEIPVRRFSNQFFFGFSTSIGQCIKISFTLNSGKQINYSESAISCLPYFFNNNDYTVTISYLFRTLTKKTDTCDKK